MSHVRRHRQGRHATKITLNLELGAGRLPDRPALPGRRGRHADDRLRERQGPEPRREQRAVLRLPAREPVPVQRQRRDRRAPARLGRTATERAAPGRPHDLRRRRRRPDHRQPDRRPPRGRLGRRHDPGPARRGPHLRRLRLQRQPDHARCSTVDVDRHRPGAATPRRDSSTNKDGLAAGNDLLYGEGPGSAPSRGHRTPSATTTTSSSATTASSARTSRAPRDVTKPSRDSRRTRRLADQIAAERRWRVAPAPAHGVSSVDSQGAAERRQRLDLRQPRPRHADRRRRQRRDRRRHRRTTWSSATTSRSSRTDRRLRRARASRRSAARCSTAAPTARTRARRRPNADDERRCCSTDGIAQPYRDPERRAVVGRVRRHQPLRTTSPSDARPRHDGPAASATTTSPAAQANDLIFGQLGNDMIQGDGSIDYVAHRQIADDDVRRRPGVARRRVAHARRLHRRHAAARSATDVGALDLVRRRSRRATDGEDYIEGNAGNDVDLRRPRPGRHRRRQLRLLQPDHADQRPDGGHDRHGDARRRHGDVGADRLRRRRHRRSGIDERRTSLGGIATAPTIAPQPRRRHDRRRQRRHHPHRRRQRHRRRRGCRPATRACEPTLNAATTPPLRHLQLRQLRPDVTRRTARTASSSSAASRCSTTRSAARTSGPATSACRRAAPAAATHRRTGPCSASSRRATARLQRATGTYDDIGGARRDPRRVRRRHDLRRLRQRRRLRRRARTTTSSAAGATTGSPAAPATTASSATTAASSRAATSRRLHVERRDRPRRWVSTAPATAHAHVPRRAAVRHPRAARRPTRTRRLERQRPQRVHLHAGPGADGDDQRRRTRSRRRST